MNTQTHKFGWLGVVCLAALSACGGSGGGSGAPAPAGTLQFVDTSFDAAEGTVVNILVARSGGSSGAVSVAYATADGSAVALSDYSAMTGTLTYADGVSGNQTISIPITDDDLVENPELFTVTLSNASGATLGANSSATVNIIDNDTAELPITGNNAQAISTVVLGAITSTIDLVDILDFVGIPEIGSMNSIAAIIVTADIVTNVVPCDTGDATVTWNDADNNLTVSTGDTFDVVFNQCFLADTGTTLEGPTSLTNMVVAGDPVNQIAPWRLVTTIGFDNLSGTDGAGTAIIDGSLDLDLSSDDNMGVDLSIGTVSLTAQQAGITETLSNYLLTATFDLNALSEVITTDGTLASTLLQGAVTFETLQDFVVIGDDNPSAGQLLISDSTSSVLVTVLDNVNVQLDIDLDLDGTIDETIVVTWDDIDID